MNAANVVDVALPVEIRGPALPAAINIRKSVAWSSNSISVLLAVSKDLAQKIHSGNLIRELAPIISGRGGGSPQMAQCGGSNPEAWSQMVNELENLLVSLYT